MVETSISERGIGRPGFAAKDGTVLGGNLSSLEVPASLGMDEVLIIETDGRRPIIHVRTDLEPDSVEAKLLALEDNETGAASYRRDLVQLAKLAAEVGDAVVDILPDDVINNIVKQLASAGDESEGDTQSAGIAFRFGDYSALISDEVYNVFAGAVTRAREDGIASLSDILNKILTSHETRTAPAHRRASSLRA